MYAECLNACPVFWKFVYCTFQFQLIHFNRADPRLLIFRVLAFWNSASVIWGTTNGASNISSYLQNNVTYNKKSRWKWFLEKKEQTASTPWWLQEFNFENVFIKIKIKNGIKWRGLIYKMFCRHRPRLDLIIVSQMCVHLASDLKFINHEWSWNCAQLNVSDLHLVNAL